VFTTAKSPDDVKSFHTNERMNATGWQASQNSTSLSGGAQGIPQVDMFCVFAKQ
jgi:hypothetical protein